MTGSPNRRRRGSVGRGRVVGRPAATATCATALLAVLVACAPSSQPRPDGTGASSPTPQTMATFPAHADAALGATTVAALQDALDRAKDIGYPDALATVITPDGIWSGASGIDGPDGRKAEPGDVVSIASVTKTFTAALVMHLVEEGAMDLDAPLSDYLDAAAAAKSNGATVRQALAMRAGLPDTQDEVRDAALTPPEKVYGIDEIVAALPDPVEAPGRASAASNPTYKLLALAAERAGGGDWADLVRTELVEPAEVPGVLVVQTAGVRTPGRWALPSFDGPWGAGGTLPFVADTTFSHGATDMAADTRSLATWFWALMEGKVVSASSLATMAVPDGDIGSGLDVYGGTVPFGTLGHQGSKDGYGTIALADPTSRTVVVVATNDGDAALDVMAGYLFDALG